MLISILKKIVKKLVLISMTSILMTVIRKSLERIISIQKQILHKFHSFDILSLLSKNLC